MLTLDVNIIMSNKKKLYLKIEDKKIMSNRNIK